MNQTRKFIEQLKTLQRISPQSTSSQVNGAAYVDVGIFRRLVAKFNIGAIAASGTLTVQVRQAKDAAGTGVKALIASAAYISTDGNNDVWLEFKDEDCDIANGYHFVRLEIVAATAASVVSAELLGFNASYEPVVQPVTTVGVAL